MKITIESDDGCKVTAEGDASFIKRIMDACEKPVEIKVPDPAPYFPYVPQPWVSPYTWGFSQKCQWCGKYDCHEAHIICENPCVCSITTTNNTDGSTTWITAKPVSSDGPIGVYGSVCGGISGGINVIGV